MERNIELYLRKRKRMQIILLSISLLFYFLLPLSLIFIPDVMNQPSVFLQDAPDVVICDLANPHDLGICRHLSYNGHALGAIDA